MPRIGAVPWAARRHYLSPAVQAPVFTLVAALLLAPVARAENAPAPAPPPPAPLPFEEDFAAPPSTGRSLAMGPVKGGQLSASLGLGWHRSTLRADVGLGQNLDLFAFFDAMLLYDGLRGQNGIHGGLRWAPLGDGLLRLSVEGSAGQVFIPVAAGGVSYTTFEGHLLAGVHVERLLVYGRVGLRALHGGGPDGAPGDRRESEAGLGLELGWRRYAVGAEGFMLARPSHTGIGQWRVRVGVFL